uniref:Uncharacterized protein n=1 Tax=Calcidiscus leptoporus TaxID=127549 RepID=A0A7S0JI94_9EUKA|mmetsp:Transcript_59173/g.135725  ORF Transcript_59173/g.135725 Transcript_59173/m.135725 type:complete len:481 (+) Transcript_59173:93-1535(+)
MLLAGEDPGKKDVTGTTALIRACRSGHTSCVQAMLQGTPERVSSMLAAQDKGGDTALEVACSAGNRACVQALLDAGAATANANYPASQVLWWALLTVCGSGAVECMQPLLDAGADIHKLDSTLGSVLMATCLSGHAACTQALLDAGAEPDEHAAHHQETAIMIASSCGHTACLQILLDAGADFRRKSPDGCTALMRACWSGHTACVQALLHAGADPDETDAEQSSALIRACRAGHASCVQALIDAGATVDLFNTNPESFEQGTALMAACDAGHTSCADHLLCAGADPERALSNGATALMMACKWCHLEVVQLLSSYGASRTPPGYRNRLRRGPGTAENSVGNLGHHDPDSAQRVTTWLEETRDWSTPLHHVSLISAERTRRLLRAGADMHARSSLDAPTPLQLAEQAGAQAGMAHRLLLTAASPWSYANHNLKPFGTRARAMSLMRLGYLLARQPRFSNESQPLIDVWMDRVLPHAMKEY